MNEHPYKVEDLQEYTGILTSLEAQSGRFKMELKVEDNPVLKERWTDKNVSSIELEFRYNGDLQRCFSIIGLHAQLVSMAKYVMNVKNGKMHDIFASNLYHLQSGDTFKIKAALINNDKSALPAEIHSFEN